MLLNCGARGDSWKSLWMARRSNQSILKEINPKYSLKGLMLKLKLQFFGHLMQRTDSLEKTLMLVDWRQKEKGVAENEMVGWHHWLNGHEFEQALEDGKEKGSLACRSPWGCKELDTTERLNNDNETLLVATTWNGKVATGITWVEAVMLPSI